MTRVNLAVAPLLGLVLGACGHGLDGVRFHNQAPVLAINDRGDTQKPSKREEARKLYHYDGVLHRRLTRASELRDSGRAEGVNALDEVPDSTWFTNRIGIRDVSIEDIRRGPNRGPGPMAHKPWKILGTKIGGVAPGFLIEDQAGDKYLLKFDVHGWPEMEGGAHIVCDRLMWALGYHVTEDRLVTVRRDELILADDATVESVFGDERPMKKVDVDLVLARSELGKGNIRALVSKFVPGKPLGGFAREGTRDDDPNDLIAHERRRDLRGLYSIFAWLKHTDLKESNTLDAWLEDRDHPGSHYIAHYQIDFGKALGVMTRQTRTRSDGYAYYIDFLAASKSLMTLGIWKRPWDDVDAPHITGLGVLEVDQYDPGGFKPRFPYWPLADADKFDKFWGAKLLIRLTPAHIRAAVEEAHYSDPRATEALIRQLIGRQRKTAQYWFRRVNPLAHFTVTPLSNGRGNRMCFTDLTIEHHLEPMAQLRRTFYKLDAFNYRGHPIGWSPIVLASDVSGGRTCVDGLALWGSHDNYTIVRIQTARHGARDYSPVLVHIAREPKTGRPRVIGLRRL